MSQADDVVGNSPVAGSAGTSGLPGVLHISIKPRRHPTPDIQDGLSEPVSLVSG
jgi:hypothetical protein